jgi:RecJ-like exonuclease
MIRFTVLRALSPVTRHVHFGLGVAGKLRSMKASPIEVSLKQEIKMAEQDKKPEKPQSMSPGDEAPAGTPGTGENICPRCAGSGKLRGEKCPNCEGTGKVITGIGGA